MPPTLRQLTQDMRSTSPLHVQVLLVMVPVLILALLALYYVSNIRLAEAARGMAQRWAEALAETAASASSAPLALKDYGALEITLREIATLPGVLRIDVMETGNRPLMSLTSPPKPAGTNATQAPTKAVVVQYQVKDVTAMPGNGRATRVGRYLGLDVLQVWANVSDKSDLGRIGLTFSQEEERVTLQRLQRETLLAIAVIGTITILIAYLFLLRAVRPLQRVARFSRELSTQVGSRIDMPPGSREVAELTDALNDASVRLRKQLDDLRVSESQTQDALKSLEERSTRLNAIFELSPDGFALFDRNQKLIFCNPALMQLTGWNELARTPSVDLTAFDQFFASLCDDEHPYVSVASIDNELGVTNIYLERPIKRVLARAFRRNLGGQGESILYFRDITHETEVDRMKSEFIATAAHEFRTPMSSILGFSELLLKRKYDDTTRQDLLQTINSKAQLLNRLVTELLDLARIEARAGKYFKFVAQPIVPIIDRAVHTLHVANDARKVQITHASGLPPLEVDADKLEQVMTNILGNAYKYSPDGGPIELRTSRQQRGDRDCVCIEVQDHGIGMTDEQAGRAFDRFYRADDSGSTPGSGLGLALVKEIIEIHGGTVELVSTLGQGTTFTVCLPVKPSIARTAVTRIDTTASTN